MAAERGGRWISTLLGGTVLAVAGFGVGMLAGGLWESPDLVVHYLLGNTEEVVQAAEETHPKSEHQVEDAPSTQVGQAHPTRAESELSATTAAEKVAIQRPEGVTKEPELPAVAARPPSRPASKEPPPERIAVQVGAFAESRAAEKLAAGLRSKGYSVYLSPGADAGDARWRVRVGPIASKEEAKRTAARLKAEEKLPTWVLSEGS